MNSELSAFQRRYTRDLARIQEAERKLSVIETHLVARKVSYESGDAAAPRRELGEEAMDLVETSIGRYFVELSDSVRILDDLDASVRQAQEFDCVLRETGKLLRSRSTSMSFVGHPAPPTRPTCLFCVPFVSLPVLVADARALFVCLSPPR